MISSGREIIQDCLGFLLRPIAKFCIRHSLSIQDITSALKDVMVEVATEELEKQGSSLHISQISVMSGVHRKDVRKIFKEGEKAERQAGVVSRVIGQWQYDEQFSTKSKKPRALSFEGSDSEFYQLVAAVSRDLNPRTVLSELERLKAVEVRKGRIRLRSREYVPRGDYEEGFRLLAKDTSDLLLAVEQNIFDEMDVPHLHIRTEYDNVDHEAVPQIKEWLLKEGTLFHRRVRKFLSQHDLDINHKLKGKKGGATISIGSFSFTTDEEVESANQQPTPLT